MLQPASVWTVASPYPGGRRRQDGGYLALATVTVILADDHGHLLAMQGTSTVALGDENIWTTIRGADKAKPLGWADNWPCNSGGAA